MSRGVVASEFVVDTSEADDSAEALLLAARQVLMEHGPRRATLAEVARQAGVSRMTVYRRFESFDRLVSALLTRELAVVMAGLPHVDPKQTTVRTAVAANVAVLTRAIAEHELIVRVLAVDPESMVPLMTQRFGQTQRTAAAHLAPELRAGMSIAGGDGSIRDADPDVLAQTIVTATQSFVFGAQALANHPLGEQVWLSLPDLIDGFLREDTSS